MFSRRWLAVVVLVVMMASLGIYGCKSDSPTGPGTGTGTTVGAGVYKLTLSQWTCGMADTMMLTQEITLCSSVSFEDFLELECPVTITNNSFTLDCTSTVNEVDCSYTERLQVTGTRVGTTWTITGTINIDNESPPGCSGEPACANVMAVIEVVSGAPTGCTYAPPNTVSTTITGGPLAGKTEFQIIGTAVSGSGGILNWNFFGQAGSFTPARQPSLSSSNVANLTVSLAEIDITNLPTDINVNVMNGGLSLAAVPNGAVTYYDQTLEGTYFISTGGTGSITVREVSETHIAGRINSLSIQGDTWVPGASSPTPGTRSMNGGFFVESGSPVSAPDKAPRAGWIDRILSK